MIDCYLVVYFLDWVGVEFFGCVFGVQKFGVFIWLDEIGVDGLLLICEIGCEYFYYDFEVQVLMGLEIGLEIGIGQCVIVCLFEVVLLIGGLMLELLEIEGCVLL